VKTYGDPDFQLITTGGLEDVSTLWTSNDPTVATVDNEGLVSIKKAGNVNITAKKPASDDYKEVNNTVNIIIEKAPQTSLSIAPVGNKTVNDQTFTLIPTGGHTDLDYLWHSDDEKIATVNNTGVVNVKKAGTVTFTLSKVQNSNYHDVTPATLTVVIDKAQQEIINIDPVTNKTYGDQQFTLTTKGGSGTGSLTWTSNNNNVATVQQNTGKATITGTGIVTFTATKAADDNYLTRDTSVTVTVSKADLKITVADTQVVYLETVPTNFLIEYEGFVYGENQNDLDKLPTANTNAATGDPAGNYIINVAGAETNNYNVSYTNGKLTINKRNPNATDMSISPDYAVYNGKTHKVTVDTTGVKGFGNISNVQYNGATLAPTTPGNYIITVNVATGTNYNAVTDITVGTLTVDKATLDSVKFTVNNNTTPDKALVIPNGTKGLGTIIVKFDGNTTLPTAPGEYTVTVDHSGGDYYKDANNFEVGTYIITETEQPTIPPDEPTTDIQNIKTTQGKVWTNGNVLIVEAKHNESVRIYTLGGVLLTAVEVTADEHKELTLPTGFYVVVLDGKTHKVMIR
jgi:uncharacterized protein YjdB